MINAAVSVHISVDQRKLNKTIFNNSLNFSGQSFVLVGVCLFATQEAHHMRTTEVADHIRGMPQPLLSTSRWETKTPVSLLVVFQTQSHLEHL